MSLSASDAIFWVAVACCAVAELFILRSAFATPHARDDGVGVPNHSGGSGGRGGADRRPAGHLPPVRRATEIAWALVPAIALAFVLAATWRAMHPAPDATRAPAAAERSGAADAVRRGAPT